MLRLSLLLGALALTLAACNSRDRRVVGDGGTDSSIAVDSGMVDMRCNDTPAFSSMSCAESQTGATCPGTVSCECGSQPTSCECLADDGGGFAWRCADACDCSLPDSGVPDTSTMPGTNPNCGASYDYFLFQDCPVPIATRDEWIMQCEAARMISDTCRGQWDSYLACAVMAEIMCVDTGELLVPQPVDCPEPPGTECVPAAP